MIFFIALTWLFSQSLALGNEFPISVLGVVVLIIFYVLQFLIFNIFVLCLLSHTHKLFLGPILNRRATGKSLSSITDSEGSKNCQLSSALTVSSNFEVVFVSFILFLFFSSFI